MGFERVCVGFVASEQVENVLYVFVGVVTFQPSGSSHEQELGVELEVFTSAGVSCLGVGVSHVV